MLSRAIGEHPFEAKADDVSGSAQAADADTDGTASFFASLGERVADLGEVFIVIMEVGDKRRLGGP